MKKSTLLLLFLAVQASLFAQRYFPEGTTWKEIRLDTEKYDSWYSQVGEEWVPNFETIVYSVKGKYNGKNGEVYHCVYTDGPDWTEKLTLLLQEEGMPEYFLRPAGPSSDSKASQGCLYLEQAQVNGEIAFRRLCGTTYQGTK